LDVCRNSSCRIKKKKNFKKNIKKLNSVIKLYKKYGVNIKKNDEEFEKKSANMNFTREQIIRHRELYNKLHEEMLRHMEVVKEITAE
jgi:gas vesicle protein